MTKDKSELRFRAFGIACHICVEDMEGRGSELLALAKSEVQRVEAKFSALHSGSIINEINECAGNARIIPLDKESRSLFEFADALWQQSNHLFDPSAGILQSCYAGGNPSEELLATRLSRVDWSRLELSTEGARLMDEGMFIDLDSCLCPYVVDSIREIFSARGVISALISLEDDIATIGKQSDGANWLVGVKHPKTSGLAITRLKLNNRGYAIRGDFERSILIDNERFGSALSPVDGRPLPGLLSVGVMADTCLSACAAASIARLKPEQAGLKWLGKLGFPWIAIDRNLNCHGMLAPGLTRP